MPNANRPDEMRGGNRLGDAGGKHDAEAWLRQLFPNANVSVQKELGLGLGGKPSQHRDGYGVEVNGETHGRGRPANAGAAGAGPQGYPPGYPHYREAEAAAAAAAKGGGRDAFQYDYGDRNQRDVARMMQRPPDGGRGRYGDAYEEIAKAHTRQAAAMMAAQKKADPRVNDAEADARRAGPAGYPQYPAAYGYGAASSQEQYIRDAISARIPHFPGGYDSRGYPPQADWAMRGDWHGDYEQFASNGKGHAHQRHGKAGGKMS
jgi:hypothetical protein